ncbi:helix-turn-helix transcriptional regulator [Hoeflea sp. G2-23]|uniref:Helix-turn-helix transcriptional regulator n=1 Tax=Hoeflea algicola TaxID=2983763 RepID=A0ABT3ZEH3_9HYPH|nr:helix-turn-helix transcriptional regulator [Hoeflea algicola]MCY0150200.1 helix-turn-helix transcriptional regulator [Hoeflea algicola]
MIRSATEFGALVRENRKKQGWTQAQLAERCGTGERFIVDLENGKPSCHLEKSLIAARTVGIDLGDLKSATSPVVPEADDDLGFLPRFS